MNITETRSTDAKARVILPPGFAKSTVIIEQISEWEVRVRKARIVPEDEVVFSEEQRPKLSDRDRDHILQLLDNPPVPTVALRKAVSQYQKRHGKRAN